MLRLWFYRFEAEWTPAWIKLLTLFKLLQALATNFQFFAPFLYFVSSVTLLSFILNHCFNCKQFRVLVRQLLFQRVQTSHPSAGRVHWIFAIDVRKDCCRIIPKKNKNRCPWQIVRFKQSHENSTQTFQQDQNIPKPSSKRHLSLVARGSGTLFWSIRPYCGEGKN